MSLMVVDDIFIQVKMYWKHHLTFYICQDTAYIRRRVQFITNAFDLDFCYDYFDFVIITLYLMNCLYDLQKPGVLSNNYITIY